MRLTGFLLRGLMIHANDELTVNYFECHSQQYDDEGERDAATEKQRDTAGMSAPVAEGI